MANLLRETTIAITSSGHTPEDIVFIGSEKSGHSCTWQEFTVIADVEYDAGFGSQKVAPDLIIVFKDGQKMWRGEYDGSEWWAYSRPFVLPGERKPMTRVVATPEEVGWVRLGEMHGEED
jgi:hypothetical protein